MACQGVCGGAGAGHCLSSVQAAAAWWAAAAGGGLGHVLTAWQHWRQQQQQGGKALLAAGGSWGLGRGLAKAFVVVQALGTV